MAHRELRETKDLTIQDLGMHNVNILRSVLAGLKEVLQQEKSPIKTPETISEPNEHLENAVQSTQQKLAAQLQQIQIMMQAMQLQYAAAT